MFLRDIIVNVLIINRLTFKEEVTLDNNNLSPQTIQRRLMHINRLHRAAVDTKVSEAGLPRGQHMTLMYLNRRGFKASQKEIADHFEISPAAVAVSLKKLESGGYIVKSTSKDDSRYNEVAITEKGRCVVEFSHRVFSEIDEKTFDGLTDEEKLQLTLILDKIEGNLKTLIRKEEHNEKMV